MKLLSIILSTFFLLALSINTYAKNDDAVFTESFDLGPKKHIVITEKMLANSRKAAIRNANDLFRLSTDPIAGNPNGSVTFVEFMDYLCPTSEAMDASIQSLIRVNPNLRIVYKQLPLRGETSIYASRAALAANNQGKYLALHVALMRKGKGLSKSNILDIAKSLGLNMPQLLKDMNSASVTREIDNTHYLARDLGLLGTPSLFFAKTDLQENANPKDVLLLMGLYDQSDLQSAINYIRKQ